MESTVKVFICVDDDDAAHGKKLYHDLKNQEGIVPFLEQEDLLPGQHRENTVNKAIRDSDYFIAMLSSRSVGKRGFIQKKLKAGLREFETFADADVFILPVRLDDCELPDPLAALTPVDFEPYPEFLDKILRILKARERQPVDDPASGTAGSPQAGTDGSDPTGSSGETNTGGGPPDSNPQPSDPLRKDPPSGHDGSRNASPQPMRPMAYALISLVALLIVIALLLLYIFKADDLVAHGMDSRFFYVLLIPLGLCAAAFLFGAMRSYAAYTGKALGGALEIGGPAVIAILVVIGGFYLVPDQSGPFSLTVYVHGSQGPQDTVLTGKGEVIMDLGGHRRGAGIGPSGEAYFPGIPARYRNQEVPISILAEGYELAYPNRKHPLAGDGVYVAVKRDDSLGRVYGTVRDESGKPLSGVSLTIDGVSSTTGADGRFEINIPQEKQRSEQVLEAWLEGYELWRDFVYPKTDTGLSITMKKTGGVS